MAQASKTFRIFVSSTFSDLKEERNALQEHVFPKLRELCLQHGCRFQAIDLRWGVSEEASRDQQTLKICLEEIKRCQRVTPRPNFILLLGDRYGWRPLPAEVPAREFDLILPRVTNPDDEALLARWYRRDNNAVPAIYCLQPRAGDFADYPRWQVVERRLHSILLQAAARMDLSPGEGVKYQASATEQEIVRGALNVEDANEHVFCFLRRITNLDDLIGDLSLSEAAASFIDVDESSRPDREAASLLGELKQRLRESLPDNIHEYEARWVGGGITTDHIGTLPEKLEECLRLIENGTGPKSLCEDVWRRLARVILDEVKKIESVDPLEKEIEDHRKFGDERAKFFTGRSGYLDAISDYVERSDPHPLAVWGEPGSGKSALMARAVEPVRGEHPKAEVIARFIGATPASSDGRALLEGLCRQISHSYGAAEADIPAEYKELVAEFPRWLTQATEEKPLILFLDALDQLSNADNARNLTWLPASLPEHVRLIVSTIPGDCLTALEKRIPTANLLKLEPMPNDEGEALLNMWLEDALRTLQPEQRAEVLGKFAGCSLPLYLKLAFEEARLWRSYDRAGPLGSDVASIIGNLFGRLSEEADHGEVMVSHSLGYLAAGKDGLTEDELLDVLSRDEHVMSEFKRRSPKSPDVDGLPVVVWSRLHLDLEHYLTERSEDGSLLLSFYHRQLEGAVKDTYLAGDAKRERHRGLAEYFAEQPLQVVKGGEKAPNLRKASELPFQQTQGGMWNKLEQTLTDLSFLETKCIASNVFNLLRDLIDALAEMPDDLPGQTGLAALYRALDVNSHVLMDDPTLLAQQVYNYQNWDETTPLGQRVRDGVNRCRPRWWLKRLNRLRSPGNRLLRTLSGHSGGVNSVAFLPKGKLLASGSSDGTARLWDVGTGALRQTLEGHDGVVFSVAFLPDGRLLASAAGSDSDRSGEVKLWDVDTGTLLKSLEADSDIWSVAFSPDAKLLVGVSENNMVRLWDVGTGQLLHTLVGYDGPAHSVLFSPKGQIVVIGSGAISSWHWDGVTAVMLERHTRESEDLTAVAFSLDGKLMAVGTLGGVLLLDAENVASGQTIGRPLPKGGVFVLSGEVWSVAFSPDGKLLASGGEDATLLLWDVKTGALLQAMRGHEGSIESVAFSPEGELVASASEDETVRVWEVKADVWQDLRKEHSAWLHSAALSSDGKLLASGGMSVSGHSTVSGEVKFWHVETGALLHTLIGHHEPIESVAFSPGGKFVASGSRDGTVQLWDVETASLRQTVREAGKWIESVAASPDGKLIASGSDGVVRLWRADTGTSLCSLDGHVAYGLPPLAVSPDGKLLASACQGAVKLWEMETGALLQTMEAPGGKVKAVAFSVDGKLVVSGSGDGKMSLWNVETGALLKTLDGQVGTVAAVAISPDGKLLASGGRDGKVRLWDASTGVLLAMLPCADDVLTLVFSPDSDQVRVADLGAGTGSPGIYVLGIINPLG